MQEVKHTLRDGSIQVLNVETIPSKMTKSWLNKIISWSSSRYESWKKKDVVEEILKGLKQGYTTRNKWNGEILITVKEYQDYFHSGSYCECSSMTRKGTYYVQYDQRVIIDCDDTDSGEITKVYKAYKF